MDGGEYEAAAGEVPLIGIFLHGGGYCHMSAHEKASTSKIPARLMKVRHHVCLAPVAKLMHRIQDKAFTEIHAVEYRLLQHAPFPAAVQDAAAVYAHIVRRHQRRGGKRIRCTKAESTNSDSEDSDKKAVDAAVDYLGVDSADYRERRKNKKENVH